VAALAVRLRLTGSHASPRGLVWHRTVHIFALLTLLYQALAATAKVAQTTARMRSLGVGVPQSLPEYFLTSRRLEPLGCSSLAAWARLPAP
jgi:hypothetical protein